VEKRRWAATEIRDNSMCCRVLICRVNVETCHQLQQQVMRTQRPLKHLGRMLEMRCGESFIDLVSLPIRRGSLPIRRGGLGVWEVHSLAIPAFWPLRRDASTMAATINRLKSIIKIIDYIINRTINRNCVIAACISLMRKVETRLIH